MPGLSAQVVQKSIRLGFKLVDCLQRQCVSIVNRTVAISMSQSDLIDKAAELFKRKFPQFVEKGLVYGIAPGRVEILGNHTDYNEGFVLSAAIDKYTVVLGLATSEDQAVLYSDHFDNSGEFSIRDNQRFERGSSLSWLNYVKGVILAMNPPTGFSAVVVSSVPVGAGVSSSAALEVATAMFLQAAFPLDQFAKLSRLEVAHLCKRAENEFVGMGCGILDQYTSVFGKEGHLIFLDCRNESQVCYVPLPSEYKLVIVDSDAPHQLVDGKYNELRRKCFDAAHILGKQYLRDVTSSELMNKRDLLERDLFQTASHVVHENENVLRAVKILKTGGDISEVGNLLSRSHESSRIDFKNSCPEIDILVDCATALPGCLGSRIQGGGFGGSTISLVHAKMVDLFLDLLLRAYYEKTGISASHFILSPAAGSQSARFLYQKISG